MVEMSALTVVGGMVRGAGFVVQFFSNQCDDVMPLVLLANLNQIFVLI